MHKENAAFNFGVIINAKVIVNVLIVVPHGLIFCRNQAGVKAVEFYVWVLFEKFFYLFVLFVESGCLATFRRCPTVFDLFAAKNNQLEMSGKQA